MSAMLRFAGAIAGLTAGLQAASQYAAWSFDWAPALGPALRLSSGARLYPPWSILMWRAPIGERAPQVLRSCALLALAGAAGGAGLAALGGSPAAAPRHGRGWGGLAQARRAGLLAREGCIVGVLEGRLLATADLRPSLVTGGTRSGKGRGHVVPTLLSWTASVLVHDPKGELWRLSAGWRSTFSRTLCFSPRAAHSIRWNPLADIHPGRDELGQIQRLVAILSDPGGLRDDEAIWDRAASEILEAVILHVLYTAPDERKTLIEVRRLLADLDTAADDMARALHQPGPDGKPEPHPFILNAVQGYASMHDRFRSSVQGTARSYLKWLAGEDLEAALSASDFAISDLMCATAPVSLYVQIAPADASALRPLARLFFYAATQALTAQERADTQGRPKLRNLLLLMDEFPLLGRVEFFEKSLRLMSGYGIKAMFVAQSLNDIVETYGPNNTILDNCHVYTAFSALDPLTQDKVSRLTGTVSEARTSRSTPTGLSRGGGSISSSQAERPLLEPGEIRGLPDDQQLVFTAGQPPLRTRKLRYDQRLPFRLRARWPAPQPAKPPLGGPIHPWAGRTALGERAESGLRTFKEKEAAILARKADAAFAKSYEETHRQMAAEEAVLDSLRNRS